MNRINEMDNTIEGKEIKTYDQDHPELVILSGRLYGKVTYVEYFDAYYLQFGDNVYYFPQKDSYQEGKNWKKKKFDSYEECLNFSQQHNIKIVMKSTVKSPFSNGLPDTRFLFPKRNTPYDPSERADVSRIRENKHNTNMNKNLIKLTEGDLHKIIKESVKSILKEMDNSQYSNNADNIGREFINFIEKYRGGSIIQDIVDFESGNQTGYPCSPLPTIIPEFEAAIGRKCTPEMRKAIKAAYNQWWYYAQNELLTDEDKEYIGDMRSHPGQWRG